MNCASHQPPKHPSPALRAPSPLLGGGERDGVRGALPASGAAAFTLVEMLVVLGIIGVLAAMTLPSFKSAGKGNVLESATRQLQDDLAFARLKAMSGRTKVYVVFAPDYNWFLNWYSAAVLNSPAITNYLFFNQAANNVIGGQLTSYAIFAPRQVGDQPGQSTPRYLTEWHSLPDGAFIPSSAFRNPNIFHNVPGSPLTNTIPVEESAGAWAPPLPFIAFDEQGRLHRHPGPVMLPVIQGSIQHPKESTGQTNIVVPTDAIETALPVPAGGIVPNIEYLVAGAPGSSVQYPLAGPTYLAGRTFLGTLANGTNFWPTNGARLVELYGVRLDLVTGRGRAVRPELP